jgi:hypothetical protein
MVLPNQYPLLGKAQSLLHHLLGKSYSEVIHNFTLHTSIICSTIGAGNAVGCQGRVFAFPV